MFDKWLNYGKTHWKACPDWLTEYAKVSKEVRASSNPKYLMHFCGSADSTASLTHTQCSGTGDRIRAMEDTVRLAAFAKRAVVLKWNHPTDLDVFVTRAEAATNGGQPVIDWTEPEREELDDTTAAEVYRWADRHPPPAEVSSGAWVKKHASDKLVALTTNAYNWPFASDLEDMPPNLGDLISSDRSCVLRSLFQPSEVVAREARRTLKRLMGDADVPYVAVHLRFGFLQGEQKHIGRISDETGGLAAATFIGQELAKRLGITAPVLVLTDNSMLRTMIATGAIKGVVGPESQSRHLDHFVRGTAAEQDIIDAHLPTFVDLALLAGAKCVIGTPSGFTRTAIRWGRPPCIAWMEDVIQLFSDLQGTQLLKQLLGARGEARKTLEVLPQVLGELRGVMASASSQTRHRLEH